MNTQKTYEEIRSRELYNALVLKNKNPEIYYNNTFIDNDSSAIPFDFQNLNKIPNGSTVQEDDSFQETKFHKRISAFNEYMPLDGLSAEQQPLEEYYGFNDKNGIKIDGTYNGLNNIDLFDNTLGNDEYGDILQRNSQRLNNLN